MAVIDGAGDLEVGERTGLSHTTIYAIRKERSDPSQDTLDRIAAAYRVRAPRLALVFDGDDDVMAVRQRMAEQLREMAAALDLATPPESPDRGG